METNTSIKTLVFILFLFQMVFHTPPMLGAKVLYIDQAGGFFIINRTSHSQNENICLLNAAKGIFICPAVVSKQGKYDAIFTPKNKIDSIREGMELKVYKSYIKKDRFLSSQFEDDDDYIEGARVADRIQVLGNVNKIEKNVEQENNNHTPIVKIIGDLPGNISPNDYQPESLPEIFVPKIRKSRRKRAEEVSSENIDKKISSIIGKTKLEAYSFINPTKGLKKSQKKLQVSNKSETKNTNIQYAFIAAEPSLHEIILDYKILTSGATTAKFNGLAFNTISATNRNPSSLWKIKGTETKGYGGIGVEVKIIRSAIHEMNLGLRNFEYRPYLQKTNFDLSALRYAAHVRTNMTSYGFWWTRGIRKQVSDHLIWGYEGGLDFDQSNLNFLGERSDSETNLTSLLASLRSTARVYSLRTGVFTRYIIRSISASFGMNLNIPVVSTVTHSGSVDLPEGITFGKDPVDDLVEQLAHDKSTYGIEITASVGVPL